MLTAVCVTPAAHHGSWREQKLGYRSVVPSQTSGQVDTVLLDVKDGWNSCWSGMVVGGRSPWWREILFICLILKDRVWCFHWLTSAYELILYMFWLFLKIIWHCDLHTSCYCVVIIARETQTCENELPVLRTSNQLLSCCSRLRPGGWKRRVTAAPCWWIKPTAATITCFWINSLWHTHTNT